MDIFQTTVTAIHEICRITIFIRRVVQDTRCYEDNVSELQKELEHEFLFLETFKKLFFDDDTKTFRQFRYLPDNLTRSVDNILMGLNKCLAEYRILALKHGLDLSEAEVAVGIEQTTTSTSLSVLPTDSKLGQSYRDRFEAMITVLRRKSKAPQWALFSKAKIQVLLAEYSQWTERLRQVMMLMLLVERRVGTLTIHDIATRGAGSALGLQRTAARQLRELEDPPANFSPLDGSLEMQPSGPVASPQGDSSIMQCQYLVGTYTDAFGVSSTTVIVEKHTFNLFSSPTVTSAEKKEVRTAMVRKLAWRLKESNESSSAPKVVRDPNDTTLLQEAGVPRSHVHLLPCLGYLPIADDGYPSLLYSLPSGTTGETISTLHDYIHRSPRPALGDRFAMALSLAATVFEVHSSGWVHKDIWSRGILVFHGMERELYLVGWSSARPRSRKMAFISEKMAVVSKANQPDKPINPQPLNRSNFRHLEPELYRHPERYEAKSAGFTAKHDIYSVGVVLLEIAIWTTMSKQFAGPISKANEKQALPPVEMVTGALSKLTRDGRVAQEMGEEYTRIIRRCLETDFEVHKHDEQQSGLLGQFQELVVDRLKVGAAI